MMSLLWFILYRQKIIILAAEATRERRELLGP